MGDVETEEPPKFKEMSTEPMTKEQALDPIEIPSEKLPEPNKST